MTPTAWERHSHALVTSLPPPGSKTTKAWDLFGKTGALMISGNIQMLRALARHSPQANAFHDVSRYIRKRFPFLSKESQVSSERKNSIFAL